MSLAGDKKTGWWTEAEDDQLRKLVAEHGTTCWAYISLSIPGRNGKSCRLRWTNQIAPEVIHAPFTSAEDAKIVEEYRKLGNRWAAISRLLPGRTENSVKNRWHACLKHRDSSAVEGREEVIGSKRSHQDEGLGVQVGRPFKKAKQGFSPLGSYITSRIKATVSLKASEYGSPKDMIPSPSESGTQKPMSTVVSPSVSGSERLGSMDLSHSASETDSSTAVEGNNFDVGADDPFTALSRWFPYGDTTKNTL